MQDLFPREGSWLARQLAGLSWVQKSSMTTGSDHNNSLLGLVVGLELCHVSSAGLQRNGPGNIHDVNLEFGKEFDRL